MNVWPGVVELVWTLSLGLAASSLTDESHDCAQLSTLKEHHSTCQHLSWPNRSSPEWYYSICEVQSNFYISSHRGETPKGTSVAGMPPLSHHLSLWVWRCHLIALASLQNLLLPLLSLNIGAHPDSNKDWLLSFFCRCVIFSHLLS